MTQQLYRIVPNEKHKKWINERSRQGACEFCGLLTNENDRISPRDNKRYSYHITKPLTIPEAILAELTGERAVEEDYNG